MKGHSFNPLETLGNNTSPKRLANDRMLGDAYRASQRQIALSDEAKMRIAYAMRDAVGEDSHARRAAGNGKSESGKGSARGEALESGRPPKRRVRLALGWGAVMTACAAAAFCWYMVMPGMSQGHLPRFYLQAYAAEEDFVLPSSEDLLVFDYGMPAASSMDGGQGWYTGCLFQVMGDHIASVAVQIDRGGLYRCDEYEIDATGSPFGAVPPDVATLGYGDDGIVICFSDTCARALVFRSLGPSVKAEGEAACARYGFEILAYTEEERASLDEDALSREWSLERLEGARFSVTVTFDDGASETKSFVLHVGNMKSSINDEGFTYPTLEFAGPADEAIEALYAVAE